jgi:hypothetical protein
LTAAYASSTVVPANPGAAALSRGRNQRQKARLRPTRFSRKRACYAKATAPAAFSALLTFGLTRNAALASMAAIALGGIATYGMATRKSGKGG